MWNKIKNVEIRLTKRSRVGEDLQRNELGDTGMMGMIWESTRRKSGWSSPDDVRFKTGVWETE